MNARSILVTLVTINILLLVAYFDLKKTHESFYQGQPLRLESGTDLLGNKWQSRGDAACQLIRLTQDSCKYCQADQPAYKSILTSALQEGCEVVEIAPIVGDMAEDRRDGVVQIKYVTADLGDALAPLVTPTTLIVDRQRILLWMHRGTIDETARRRAMSVIDVLGRN